MVVYYVIRDADHLLTIHCIKDSAEASFHELMKKPVSEGPCMLELVCIVTDQFGKVLRAVLVCTWTRNSGVIVTHMTEITGEYLLV